MVFNLTKSVVCKTINVFNGLKIYIYISIFHMPGIEMKLEKTSESS